MMWNIHTSTVLFAVFRMSCCLERVICMLMKGLRLQRKSLLEELDEWDKGMRISAFRHDYYVYWWTVIIINIITNINEDDQGSIKTNVHQVKKFLVNHHDPFLEKLKEACVYCWTLEELTGPNEPVNENEVLLWTILSWLQVLWRQASRWQIT